MYPTAAAVASLHWPSRNHLSFEQPRKPQSSLGECSIYPLKSPTRFREDPVNLDLAAHVTSTLQGDKDYMAVATRHTGNSLVLGNTDYVEIPVSFTQAFTDLAKGRNCKSQRQN